MSVKPRRRRLRLKWWLVIFGVIVGLLSTRHERNFFTDAWDSVMGADAGQNTQQSAADAIKPEPALVRKCELEDATLYSNEGCDPHLQDNQSVESHDSSGIEPSTLSSSPPADAHETPLDKVLSP